MTEVILVNDHNESLGTMEKMQAHRLGLLHRAFSIFIFDKEGRMLLQQRAAEKYHGGLLWTNACCSHPLPNENVEAAVQRRLKEELGFQTPLKEIFSFQYRAEVENNLIENEYDHVFAGEYSGMIDPNASEVADYKYEDMNELSERIKNEPEQFTTWFRIAFPKIMDWWTVNYGNTNHH